MVLPVVLLVRAKAFFEPWGVGVPVAWMVRVVGLEVGFIGYSVVVAVGVGWWVDEVCLVGGAALVFWEDVVAVDAGW